MANQHNADIPVAANTILSDIIAIRETLGFHKDCFEKICTGWSDTTTANLFANGPFNVKTDFGAIGDGDGAGGGTDDSDEIIAALTYVQTLGGNCKLVFPEGIYRCDVVLGDYTFSNVMLDFQGASIDFSNVAVDVAANLLSISGDYSATAIALSGNAASGQKTVACVSATFAVGDFVRVYSESLWDASDTSTKKGELNFIATVPDGASVTVSSELESTYNTADTAKIHEITPVRNVFICNGKFIGPAANDLLTGLLITGGINCLVDNMHFKDIDAVHCRFTDCIFSKVINSNFEQANHASQAYGVSFQNACQDCLAIGNTFVDVRHSLSTNNSVASSWGIVRRILFLGNIVSDSAYATGGTGGDAIDTHAGAEEISIISNIVNASSSKGINVECPSCTIMGNIITNCQSSGIHWGNTSDQLGTAIISDNRVYNVGLDAGSSQYGINANTYYANCSDLVISNNRVIANGTPLRLGWTSSCEFDRAIITGNVIRHSSTPTAVSAMSVEYILSGSISNNVISADDQGIALSHCDHVSVGNNSIDLTSQASEATARGIYLSSCTYCPVIGNTIKDGTNAVATTGVAFATTTTYSGIWGNVTEGFDTNVDKSSGTGNVEANNI